MVKKTHSIFHIEGGLGKHIAATAVAKAIKNNHPDRDLIVVCSYPEVFVNLEYVHRVYRTGNTPYFYQDYIESKDFLIFKHEPYFTNDHLKKELSLIENWCKLYDLNYSGELPEIKFNFSQEQFNQSKWLRGKPVLLLHTNGGPINDQPFSYAWTRDMPHYLYQSIIDTFGQSHHIIQVCRNESQVINHSSVEAIYAPLSNMELFGLVKYSSIRLLIDSSLQHAAAAMNKPSTVLWIGTDPTVFGYDIHTNIKAQLGDEEFKLPDSYLFNYSFSGVLHECPIADQTKMFDISEIIKSLKS